MVSRKQSTAKVYQLRVELEGIVPPVWRRIVVPGSMTLPKLHDLLQLVMGWMDSHLHSFTISNHTYSRSLEDGDLAEMKMLDESRHTLVELLGDSVTTFIYEYDFGDGWGHRIDIEAVMKPEPDRQYPLCLAAARAAPPEDVGGVPGYQEFLDAIGTPDHEEHDSMLTWIGGAFDPAGFDLNTINRTLRFGVHPAIAKGWK